ncbi:protein PRRC1-B-like [Cylas formicarius]|uniref:protein PRRC1-B-like n=1 Tax=Cylas formicarius TaxID=197179 RepID=UPI002958A206|nr:protein PRRC1-B-like [Cylas formicarius]
MQESDSNGSSSFEIVEKKDVESAKTSDKSETLSISSPYSISSQSSTSISVGNILSSVAPPAAIPDFKLWTPAGPQIKPTPHDNQIAVTAAPAIDNQFPVTQFSAAIPPSKGVPQEPFQKRNIQPPEAESISGTSFLGLVKGALSNPVFTKMAEKAKSSVDSLITTLDPQMSEYIYSGGDTEFIVTSTDEEIISAIREAVHSILGKAWVNGINLPSDKTQAVGFKEGLKRAKDKVEKSYKIKKAPIVAVENILLYENESWYDESVLLLIDAEKNINLSTFSQATPVPTLKFLKQIDSEYGDSDKTVEQKLAEYLKAIPGWQEEVSGVSRKEVILLAAKTLFKLYKEHLPQNR